MLIVLVPKPVVQEAMLASADGDLQIASAPVMVI